MSEIWVVIDGYTEEPDGSVNEIYRTRFAKERDAFMYAHDCMTGRVADRVDEIEFSFLFPGPESLNEYPNELRAPRLVRHRENGETRRTRVPGEFVVRIECHKVHDSYAGDVFIAPPVK